MNIFVLHAQPMIAARWHSDVHVISQCKEGAQILSSALYLHDLWEEGLNKPTHLGHPCVVWAAETPDNWRWLFELVFALNCEFMKFGRTRTDHKSMDVADRAFSIFDANIRTAEGMTPWPQVMPDEYRAPYTDEPVSRHVGDTHPSIQAYRRYYVGDKLILDGKPAKWSHRERPPWIGTVESTDTPIFEDDPWD